MRCASSVLFASRLLFPRTGKKSNARRSLVGSCICIGISLVPLVMVLAVSNGMIAGITDRMIGLSSSHIQLALFPESEYARDCVSMQIFSDRIAEHYGVRNVYPELQGIALASSANGRFGAAVRAVPEDMFERNESFRTLFEVVSGSVDLKSRNSCVIGKKLADDLGVQAGNTIRLITTKENGTSALVPKITVMNVSAVVSSGYQELDAMWLFIPLRRGFELLSGRSCTAVIGIETGNAFGSELERTFASLLPFVSPSGRLSKWNELNTAQYENFASTRILLVFIMMLIVLVASVNISSALVMLVMERKKEIAIIKSLGGTSSGIAFSFIMTGIVTGAVGVVVGIPLGLFCAVNFTAIMETVGQLVSIPAGCIHVIRFGSLDGFSAVQLLDPAFYLQNVPLFIPVGQLMLVGAGTVLLSFLVSVIPALRAGKEKPIETLRKM